MFCVLFILIARMFDLAIIRRPFLQHQGDLRALRVVDVPVFRGMITDRNGYPLAVSAPVLSVWVDPTVFHPTQSQQALLEKSLHLSLQKQLQGKNQRHFVWLKRRLPPDFAASIEKLHVPGLYFTQEYQRFYPEGEIAAHVTGFTGVDDRGQEGVELLYNDWLAGSKGKQKVVRDRLGHVVSEEQTVQKQNPGRDVVLSLNRRIQYLAYQALLNGIQENQATSGSAVVLDTKTGEILAMVNQPSYNPNHIVPKEKNNFRNRAVTDLFEPGSTMKTFSILAALESGQYQPTSEINTWPGWMRVGHHLVRDEHNNHTITLQRILEVSSNVGMSKVILSLPADRLPNLLRRVGFGQVTHSYFPGEATGRLPDHFAEKSFPLATLSFGYGVSITALQLAKAYSIFANDGILIPVSLLRVDQPPVGQRVIEEKYVRQMLTLLRAVVDSKGGTGRLARVPGYQVAGKTGTSWIAGKHGYDRHRYTSSFVGIAPFSHPRFVVAVVIREPRGKRYLGGDVSAPVFSKIMAGTLRTLDVPPDDA
ncbi:MAG: penicillin-binding protein 2 [Gammaproteobacteria bacterium]|nr:penicillin-binding protein 2 [Gammaproteobacteria bacterium]